MRLTIELYYHEEDMMSNPVLTAAILIEANGAALNNAGNDAGQRLDNAVVVKQIKVGKIAYPYISGQAVRRWWREVLYADYDWQPSPVTREAKSAFTEGNPVQYPDDDVFGYMAAKKAKKPSNRQKTDVISPDTQPLDDTGSGGTQRRVSPLKNSLLVSVLPRVITSDFGHFSRDLPVDNPNMVPFEHEHYTTLMQGVFTLSMQDVGRFECGLMRDVALDTPVPDGGQVVREAEGNLKPRVLGLSAAVRRKRVVETVQALGRLRYGANLTRNLSDVVPVVVLLGYLDGGNAPFQNLFVPFGEEGVRLNIERLRSVIKDYKDRLLGDKQLYFGYRPGVLANEEEVLQALGMTVKAGDKAVASAQEPDTSTIKQPELEGVTFFVGTPGEAIEQTAIVAQKDGLL